MCIYTGPKLLKGLQFSKNIFDVCICPILFPFSDTHACKELHKRSHKFALQNFQEVMSTEEFLLLPFQEVRAPLKYTEICGG